jgi:hypothetical protein
VIAMWDSRVPGIIADPGDLFISKGGIQRGPKVTSLVALSSRGRCAQHLHDVRGRLHDAHRTQVSRDP